MTEENISQEFRLKNVNKTRSYFIEEINQHELIMNWYSKLDSIEIFISKTLIDSGIIHGEFVLVNNVVKEYDNTKEIIKTL